MGGFLHTSNSRLPPPNRQSNANSIPKSLLSPPLPVGDPPLFCYSGFPDVKNPLARALKNSVPESSSGDAQDVKQRGDTRDLKGRGFNRGKLARKKCLSAN